MLSENKQIVIVEDNASERRAMKALLVSYGFTVDTFSSAEKLFGVVPCEIDGCLIMDVHMPGLDGVEPLKRIIKAWPDRPVIIISGDRNEGFSKRAIESGASGFLQKPFKSQELVGLIDLVFEMA